MLASHFPAILKRKQTLTPNPQYELWVCWTITPLVEIIGVFLVYLPLPSLYPCLHPLFRCLSLQPPYFLPTRPSLWASCYLAFSERVKLMRSLCTHMDTSPQPTTLFWWHFSSLFCAGFKWQCQDKTKGREEEDMREREAESKKDREKERGEKERGKNMCLFHLIRYLWREML